MHFPLGKPVLAMVVVALVSGGAILSRGPSPRAEMEVWTFAQTHADLYGQLKATAAAAGTSGDRAGGPPAENDLLRAAGVRLVPNNALNVRLVSLFMADRAGRDLPDVVEIRQDALGRYLGPAADQIGFLPLNDLLATTGERMIASVEAPGAAGQSARLASDGKVYTHDGRHWRPDPGKPAGDRWIDRIVHQRFAPYTKAGQIFGLPHDVHPVTLTYRADLFAAAGVDLETPTAGRDFVTWADFQQRCLRFQAYWRGRGVADRWAVDLFAANADVLAALLLQRGVNLIDPDGRGGEGGGGGRVRLTDPVVVDTLTFYAGLVAGPGRVSADATAGGVGALCRDLEAGTVCALVTPDWRIPDLRTGAPGLAGKLRMTRLPKFEAADAPTSTWGGTMIAIPRKCQDPQKAWRLVEAVYLSEPGMTAQARDLGILPAVADFWTSPAVRRPDPLFGGQIVNDLYVELAPLIPTQHLTPDTAYATSALGYALSQAVGAVRGGAEPAALKGKVDGWLQARQADVERQLAHGQVAAGG
jgi:arabinosaccharide transport system substrate-binding protein